LISKKLVVNACLVQKLSGFSTKGIETEFYYQRVSLVGLYNEGPCSNALFDSMPMLPHR